MARIPYILLVVLFGCSGTEVKDKGITGGVLIQVCFLASCNYRGEEGTSTGSGHGGTGSDSGDLEQKSTTEIKAK